MKPVVIFDFDGVVADTESLHWLAFQEILEPRGMGVSWDEYLGEFVGYDDRGALRAAYQRAGKPLSAETMERLIRVKAAAFVALAKTRDEIIYPGASELICQCSDAGWILAICSGALLEDIVAILQGTELLDRFDVVVTSEDVTVSKPDPESYHQVVTRLGIDPHQAVVIEDTPAGIAAAQGAGLRVVGIASTHEAGVLSDANRIVSGIGELSLEYLAGVLREPA